MTIANWAAAIVPFTVTQAVPTRASVGAPITATTRVSDQHGRGVGNWLVTLQKMPKGSTHYWSVRSLRTTSSGGATFRFASGASGHYRWVTWPATGAPSEVSPAVAVTSIARVIEERPATSIAHGRYLSVNGSVSLAPDAVVYIHYRVGSGPWRTASRAAVKGTAVSARIAINLLTSVDTRFYARTTASYSGSISNYFRTAVE